MTFCSSVWNHVSDSWQYQEPIYDVFSQLNAVKRDPENLRRCRSSCGKEISEEVCLAAVEQDGHTLSYVKNPTEKTINVAVATTPAAIQYVKISDEITEEKYKKLALNAVKRAKRILSCVTEFQDEEIQLAAVRKDKTNIRWLDEPTEETMLDIINMCSKYDLEDLVSYQGKHLKKHLNVYKKILKKNPDAIKFISDVFGTDYDNPERQKLINFAASIDGMILYFFEKDHQSKELQMLAIQNTIFAYHYCYSKRDYDIKSIVINTAKEKINQDPKFILEILDSRLFSYNFVDELTIQALSLDGFLIEKIIGKKYITEEMQLAAVKQNRECYKLLKDPSEKVLDFVFSDTRESFKELFYKNKELTKEVKSLKTKVNYEPPSNLSEKEIRRREIAFKRLRNEIETRVGVNWKNWRTEISPGELEWILK